MSARRSSLPSERIALLASGPRSAVSNTSRSARVEARSCSIERMTGRVASRDPDDGRWSERNKCVPEGSQAPAVILRGHQNQAIAVADQLLGDRLNFLRGVLNRASHAVNRLVRDAEDDENSAAVFVLRNLHHANLSQGHVFLARCPLSDPDLGRPALVIKIGGFDRAEWHLAAQDDDGARRLERILDDEPAT